MGTGLKNRGIFNSRGGDWSEEADNTTLRKS